MGVTDNGTGSAVTLETARILAAVGAKPKRTIRFVLWTGEEQGLLGSRGYVDSLSDEEKAKIVCCFVDDGGTNTQGAITGIDSMRDYLAAATAPINGRIWDETDGKFLNVDVKIVDSMPRGGGSDHASFNAVGIPGFYWEEIGRAVYGYGWHTQYDRLDLAIPNYLRQSRDQLGDHGVQPRLCSRAALAAGIRGVRKRVGFRRLILRHLGHRHAEHRVHRDLHAHALAWAFRTSVTARTRADAPTACLRPRLSPQWLGRRLA